MKKWLILLSFGVALGGATSASCASYKVIDADTKSMTMIDTDTIESRNGYMRFWLSEFYPPKQADGRYVIKILHEVDCAERRVRQLAASSYGQDVVSALPNSEVSHEWTYVAPGTVGNALVTYVCRSKWEVGGIHLTDKEILDGYQKMATDGTLK